MQLKRRTFAERTPAQDEADRLAAIAQRERIRALYIRTAAPQTTDRHGWSAAVAGAARGITERES